MTVTYLNQQSILCYQGSAAKGFWDKERNKDEAIALTIGELYEGLEAHRAGKIANVEEFIELTSGPDTMSTEQYAALFKEKIKDTVGDEMADAFIRLMDFCGGFKITFGEYEGADSIFDPQHGRWPENFGQGIILLNKHLLEALLAFTHRPNEMHEVFRRFTVAASALFYFCRFHDIPLQQHVEWKLRFNATRERLHGKTY